MSEERLRQSEEERALPGLQEDPAAEHHLAATPAEPTAVVIRTNGFAIAALVLGILWLICVGSVLALVFGYKARRQIAESDGLQGGRRMALAGIVLGWIGVAVLPAIFVAGFVAGASGS